MQMFQIEILEMPKRKHTSRLKVVGVFQLLILECPWRLRRKLFARERVRVRGRSDCLDYGYKWAGFLNVSNGWLGVLINLLLLEI